MIEMLAIFIKTKREFTNVCAMFSETSVLNL